MNLQRHLPFLGDVLNCFYLAFVKGLLTALVLMTTVIFLTQTASAKEEELEQGGINHPGEVTRGELLFKNQHDYSAAPLMHTEVNMEISGLIARIKVKQFFSNPFDEWKEGVYVFPLPETAAVDRMKMYIGDRVIEGQIQERQQAKRTYEAAKAKGQRASLVEQERPNLFTNSVANIAPKETIVVEIEFQQQVTFDSNQFSLRFPTAITPRYIPGNVEIESFSGTGWGKNTEQVNDAARITPHVVLPGDAKRNPLSINIDLDAGIALTSITSTYHDIKLNKLKDTHFKVDLGSKEIPSDRDFELVWQAEAKDTPQAALFNHRTKEGNYSMLMLMPPQERKTNKLDRELTFVIDTSGSMSGTSIRQAKKALLLAVSELEQNDFFNVIEFNSHSNKLFSQPVQATSANISKAEYFINGLHATGGTEMASALNMAFDQNSSTAPIKQIVFLTDGSVGNENFLFNIIKKRLNDYRLFTIGIGSAPNSHFMKRAAKFGRGTHTYIGNISEVQEKMATLFNKLEKAMLADIEIDWQGNSVEAWPNKIPDLYSGEPLIVVAKHENEINNIKISGKLSGSTWNASLKLQGGQNNESVPLLWARHKIENLMDNYRTSLERDTLKQEITDTALKYHLVSKFTSLIAVDVTPARPLEEELDSQAMPVNLPHGQQHQKIFGSMPQGGLPIYFQILIGSLCLLLSLFRKKALRHYA